MMMMDESVVMLAYVNFVKAPAKMTSSEQTAGLHESSACHVACNMEQQRQHDRTQIEPRNGYGFASSHRHAYCRQDIKNGRASGYPPKQLLIHVYINFIFTLASLLANKVPTRNITEYHWTSLSFPGSYNITMYNLTIISHYNRSIFL
jgi:hypothetical protein